MIERRKGDSFALKPAHSIMSLRKFLRQHLEGDVTLQPSVVGSIYFSHSTGTKQRNQLVCAQFTPDPAAQPVLTELLRNLFDGWLVEKVFGPQFFRQK